MKQSRHVSFSHHRALLGWLGLVGLYYVAGNLGLAIASLHPSASPVWPPTGIALAAVVIFGNRMASAVFLAAFLVNAGVTGVSWTSFGIALGNTLEAVCGGYLVKRFAGGRAAFETPAGILTFAWAGPIVSSMISATVGVASLSVGGHAEWAQFRAIWFTWWLGDAAGAVILAPAILLWTSRTRLARIPGHVAEFSVLIAAGAFTSLLVFADLRLWVDIQGPTAFLVFPFVIWAGLRFGARGAATMTILIGCVAVWGTVGDHGPFAVLAPNDAFLLLQTFLSILSLTGLILGAASSSMRNLHLDLENRVKARTREMEQSNQALRRMEGRFRNLLESAPDAMVIVGQDGRIALANSQTRSLFGYTSDELIGQPVEILVPEQFRSRHVIHREGFNREPRTRPMGSGLELYGRRKDGSQFSVEIQLSPIQTEEGTLIAGAIRDVTDRRKAEQQIRSLNEQLELRVRERTMELEHANKELDAFTYTVAHDLRSPLRALNSFSKILYEDHSTGLTPEGKRYVKSIERNARRMGEMVDGLLAFARLGREDLKMRPVMPERLVRESWSELSAAFAGREVELSVGDLPSCRGEPNLLRHVFLNLLDNALKFTRGRERAKISVGWTQNGGTGAYYVADNGVGFDMRHAEKLFKVFESLHERDSYEGTGVGLAIVKRIVSRHGGRVWAEAQPETGATFYFSLEERSP